MFRIRQRIERSTRSIDNILFLSHPSVVACELFFFFKFNAFIKNSLARDARCHFFDLFAAEVFQWFINRLDDEETRKCFQNYFGSILRWVDGQLDWQFEMIWIIQWHLGGGQTTCIHRKIFVVMCVELMSQRQVISRLGKSTTRINANVGSDTPNFSVSIQLLFSRPARYVANFSIQFNKKNDFFLAFILWYGFDGILSFRRWNKSSLSHSLDSFDSSPPRAVSIDRWRQGE